MITTSQAWKDYAKDNTIYHVKAVLTDGYGTVLNLTDADFMDFKITDSTSDTDTFSVGAVVTNSCEFTLNNVERKFEETNFQGATINVQLGMEWHPWDGLMDDTTTHPTTSEFTVYPNTTYRFIASGSIELEIHNSDGTLDYQVLTGTRSYTTSANAESMIVSVINGTFSDVYTEEYINRGIYTIDRPSSLGNTIQVTAYDYADKLNKYYIGKIGSTISDITFPITSSALVQGLCNYCGVTFDSWNLPSDLSVAEFEYDESTTCRQVIGWVLQLNGGFGKMTPNGTFKVSWYDAKVWTDGSSLDGGLISDNGAWGASDTADGGTMWVAVASYDGGEMLSGAGIEFNKVATTSVGVDDISITGVRAYAYGTVSEFEFETVGEGGYVLALSENPLINSSNMLAVATAVYNQCQDLRFRIFNASVWASPDIEAGDSCLIQDYRGVIYPSIITNFSFVVNGLSEISLGAETPTENSLETANPTTQTIGGAVTAAYDYLLAKKISADYVDAGTLTGTVVAKDLIMEGGSISIETDTTTYDSINLNHDDSSGDIDYTHLGSGQITVFSGTKDISPGSSYETHEIGLQATHVGGTPIAVLSVRRSEDGSNTDVLNVQSQGAISAEGTLDIKGYNGSGTLSCSINSSTGQISAMSWGTLSKAETKKDIEPFEGGLEKVLATDIYKYRYKDEDGKKHIGAVIGYNCCDEIIRDDYVDLYSMISVLWQAVKEQQIQINELKEQINGDSIKTRN